MAHCEIRIDASGKAEVLVEGQRLRHVRRVAVSAEAGSFPQVVAEILAFPASLDVHGRFTALLVVPDEEARSARDLYERLKARFEQGRAVSILRRLLAVRS